MASCNLTKSSIGQAAAIFNCIFSSADLTSCAISRKTPVNAGVVTICTSSSAILER